MKFKSSPGHRQVTYRLCDELECNRVAMHVETRDKGPNEYEKHLCETHYLRYKEELKDVEVKK